MLLLRKKWLQRRKLMTSLQRKLQLSQQRPKTSLEKTQYRCDWLTLNLPCNTCSFTVNLDKLWSYSIIALFASITISREIRSLLLPPLPNPPRQQGWARWTMERFMRLTPMLTLPGQPPTWRPLLQVGHKVITLLFFIVFHAFGFLYHKQLYSK